MPLCDTLRSRSARPTGRCAREIAPFRTALHGAALRRAMSDRHAATHTAGLCHTILFNRAMGVVQPCEVDSPKFDLTWVRVADDPHVGRARGV